MHAAIYQRYPCDAVVHTHSTIALRREPRMARAAASKLPGRRLGGDDVPCVPYSTFGRQKLADDAADALAERTACLLANHGMIARGPNLVHAVDQAHRLEVMCRQYVLARQLGEPKRLTTRDWEDFRKKGREMAYARNG